MGYAASAGALVPLDKTTIPFYLSPSRFADLFDCPLSALHGLPAAERLPPAPLAVLGTVLHEVAERWEGGGPDPAGTFAELFGTALASHEKQLVANPDTVSLVPLQNAVGRLEWRTRVASFQKRVVASGVSRFPKTSARRGIADSTAVPTGTEVRLAAPSLRLSGVVDRIHREGELFVLTDYKSGAVTGPDGLPLPRYALQLELYALMVEALYPDVRLALRLVGAEMAEVEWNDDSRREISSSLADMLSRLPAGASLPAASLACPGRHCGRCGIRHRCSSYLEIAPVWWLEESQRGPVAPFDVWGRIAEVGSDQDGLTNVVLKDQAGRTVDVARLRPRPSTANLRRGENIAVFGLEPTERLEHRAGYRHPRNFHEVAPNSGWASARGACVFTWPEMVLSEPETPSKM